MSSNSNNNQTESNRGLSSKDVGRRDLGIKKSTSKASKLLGASTQEILNSSTSNLNNSSSDNSSSEKSGKRNSIGGILRKGLGLKGGKSSSKFNDSDSDLQITSDHGESYQKSKNNTISASAQKNENPPNRAVSWGVESVDGPTNTDKPTPLYSPTTTNDMNKGRYLMERNMSRRNRQSFRLGRGGTSFYVNPSDPRATQGDPLNNMRGIGKCNNMVKHIRVNAILSSTNASTKSLDFEKEDSLETVILDSLSKKGLCDVQLVGGLDNVVVDAPSYLLGVHSEVFENLFYPSSERNVPKAAAAQDEKRRPSRRTSDDEFRDSCSNIEEILDMDLQEEEEEDDDDDNDLDTSLRIGEDGVLSPSNTTKNKKRPTRVELPFATSPAIKATLHFLVTRSLPQTLEKEESETNIRTIVQVHLLGRIYKINSLEDHSNRTARLLMNKMPRLLCAAFDECIASKERLPIVTGRMSFVSSSHDELMEYCLDYLRDSPLTTLLEGGGTVFLNKKSISAIICDQDMDVDEHTMFHILNTWVKQDVDNNIETGRELVSNINLAYIKSDYLNNIVRKCGFVDVSIIEKALRDIEEMLENQSPDEKEHALVEGAGNKDINGIYVRMDEDIGLGEEEVMYVKEAQDDDDGYGADYGLYLLRSTWAITSCVDYSNVLYSCNVTESSTNPSRAPKDGWKAVNGNDPPPSCTWSPGKEFRETSSGKGYVAPNLADAGKNKKRVSDIANGDHCEGSLVRRLTLRTLCNLPTDEDFEEDDYHGEE